jgi:hypothetical protein
MGISGLDKSSPYRKFVKGLVFKKILLDFIDF